MKTRTLLFSCLAIVLAGCKPAANAPAEKAAESAAAPSAAKSNKPQVLVANYPLQYFAQRLAGDAVEVRLLAPKGEDPAFWQPDEAAITAFQNADLILMNGAGYSKWADKVTLPESKVVETSAAFANNFIIVRDATTHSHGPGGEHSHNGTAFTTWIDFKQASLQAQAVQASVVVWRLLYRHCIYQLLVSSFLFYAHIQHEQVLDHCCYPLVNLNPSKSFH